MSYTYTDPEYPALPKLKDWIGQKAYYYEDHGWGRNSQKLWIMK